MSDGIYRGFVEVREVVDRAINDSVIAMVNAAVRQRDSANYRPSSRFSTIDIGSIEYVFLQALKARGFVKVTWRTSALELTTEIAALHRCKSVCVVSVDEIGLTLDPVDAMRDALDRIACYCVPTEEQTR